MVSRPNDNLANFIARAKDAVMVEIYSCRNTGFLDACIQQSERGLAVEMLINRQTRLWLEEDPFLMNKCLQLVRKGGAIFLAEDTVDVPYRCMIDFAGTLDGEDVQSAVRKYDVLRNNAEPYLVERGDIRIDLRVSDQFVLKGDSVEIAWDVDKADKVVLQGAGVVKDSDVRRLSLQQSTIIKIGAYNSQQSQVRAVKIWVSEQVKISYNIGFLGRQTNEFYSLVHADNYPHVYGVAGGSKIRFMWEALDSNDVTVYPFGISNPRGTHEFTPTQSSRIEIRARVQDVVVTRKITLLVFPLPVFEDKLVTLSKFNDYKNQFVIPDSLRRTIDEHGITSREEAEQRYARICLEISKQAERIRSEKFNLKHSNTTLFSFLKRRNKEKGGIVRILQTIQDYYNPSSRG